MSTRSAAPRRPLARWPWLVLGTPYVLLVGAVAAYGFATDSTAGVLVAAALSLPLGVVALVGYYLVYGLLTHVPGANPSVSTGSVRCSAAGVCHDVVTGGQATWFVHTTDVIGVAALVVAAVLDLLLVRLVVELFRL